MKAGQPFIPSPVIRKTILKLAFVGTVMMTCMYGLVKLFESAISIL